jgi:hypothetical protein
MTKIKIKPIPCLLHINYTKQSSEHILTGKIDLHQGEITLNKFIWIPNKDLTVEFDFNNQFHFFEVSVIGGKYIVADYKNQPIFKDILLFNSLNKTLLTSKPTTMKAKI